MPMFRIGSGNYCSIILLMLLELKNINVNLRVELWRDPLIESTG